LGCSAALFIFVMSITGVALTYERQMIKFAESLEYAEPENDSTKIISLDEAIIIANNYPSKKTPSITLVNESGAPIIVKDGRKTLAYINPYNGIEMAEPGQGTKVFFKKLRAFHRWLTLDGKFSETGRWVNGIANVIFFILLLTGLYLWLPKKLKVKAFKQKLTLSSKHSSIKARDYQWHNVFGFYMLPILVVVVATAFFFSFKWPGETLKNNVSTEGTNLSKPMLIQEPSSLSHNTYQALAEAVKTHYPKWQTIRLTVPTTEMNAHIFHVDLGNGGEPQKRLSLLVDTQSGEILEQQSFSQLSDYRKARSYIRFLHTGEAFGIVGQTLAGIASLLACLLVYTGVMLSWRRWKQSQTARKSAVINAKETSA